MNNTFGFKLPLTKDNLLKYVTKEQIYKYYLAVNFKFDVVFSSPFRKDKHPSFIISGEGKGYTYYDFSTGAKGDCFEFVKTLYNCSFNEALIKIASDFELNKYFDVSDKVNYTTLIDNKTKAVVLNQNLNYNTGDAIINVTIKPFEQYDYDYWHMYGINSNYIKLSGIYAISHYFINGKCFRAEKYSYAYIEKKDDVITYKIYQPYSKVRKWISSNNNSIWELWTLLPEYGDEVIITSSRKDALSIMSNLNIPATALQAESTTPKRKVVEELLRRFKRVYLLFDNDYTNDVNNGQILAQKLLNQNPELINLMIPSKYKSKDYSDLYYNYKEQSVTIIKNIIYGR